MHFPVLLVIVARVPALGIMLVVVVFAIRIAEVIVILSSEMYVRGVDPVLAARAAALWLAGALADALALAGALAGALVLDGHQTTSSHVQHHGALLLHSALH